jgi:hypothetical protein
MPGILNIVCIPPFGFLCIMPGKILVVLLGKVTINSLSAIFLEVSCISVLLVELIILKLLS